MQFGHPVPKADIRSNTVVMLLMILCSSFFPLSWIRVSSLFCYALLSVSSMFAIILMGKRYIVA